MHLIIIILIVLVTCTKVAFGQTDIDEDLLRIEQKVFECRSDSVKAKLLLQKADLYLAENISPSNALNEMKRINYKLLKDAKDRQRFLWNSTLLSLLNKEFNRAHYYYNNYQALYPDSTIESELLNILIYNRFDTNKVSLSVNQLSKINNKFSCLCCLNDLNSYKRKNKNIYLLLSALIPGSGNIFNGYIFQGLNSMILVSAAGYAVLTMAKHQLLFNAISWGIALGIKFYGGNILLTNKLLEQKELKKKNRIANECELIFSKILDENPIVFK